MPVHDLKDQIARLPEQPGVYLWGDAKGDTIYVGKARSLRDRVRSYLGAYGMSPRHDALLDDITRLEVIVTDSVMEALALENNLIKQRMPRYNILLRDDKNYPYLQLTTSEAFPRVLVARSRGEERRFLRRAVPAGQARAADDDAVASAVRHPVVQRGDHRTARTTVPRVRHQALHRSVRGGDLHARSATAWRWPARGCCSKGATTSSSRRSATAWRRRRSGERFEEAAQLRDAMRTVQTLRDRQQKVATAGLGDRDVFGLKVGPSGGAIQVFQIRGGRVVERVELSTDPGAIAGGERDVLQAALSQFYELRAPAAEINLPVEIEDVDAMEEWLTRRAGRRVRVLVPQRGDKRALVELATRNAELSYRTRFNEITASHFEALETLRSELGLPSIPRRIECFDISTIQGSETVASMVVCEDGRMKRNEYRKFRVRGSTGSPGSKDRASGVRSDPEPVRSDDFAAMREVVQRRYRAVLEAGDRFPISS